jgi:RNA polymerase sigma-70 factor (ECF subfamily)
LPDDLSLLPDADLMLHVQAGQTSLFAELIRRYQPALLRVARSRLRRADWAEDVVQETFLAAYKSRHTYRGEFSFRTWLWTILLNQCRSLWQRQSRRPESGSWPTAGDEATEAATAQSECSRPLPLNQLLARERGELLESLLARLSTVQADALRLRFFGGLKFQEIADAMGCSLGTAKNRVHWGLMKLSELLQSEASFQSLAEDWLTTDRHGNAP